MHIVIAGAAGFLGNKLARTLLDVGTLIGPSGQPEKITRMTLVDVVAPVGFSDSRVEIIEGDISDPKIVDAIIIPSIDSIFHLAAIVSGHAEVDFDLGMKINFDATRQILDRARALGTQPRMVFTSSVAVFGGDLPAKVPDNMGLMPQSSYGAQKAMCELLVNDYSRRGYIDGRVLRMPTISVRPGVPNKAASSFASGILREPINGQNAVCPVSSDTRLWLMSPRQAVQNLIYGHNVDATQFANSRIVSLPGLSVTVREMVDALESVAGTEVTQRIQWIEDDAVKRIVNSWPGDFEATRAKAMGFTADTDFISVIRAHIQDESAA
ncbi:D-erythronate dehydrogenase [Pusillimonas sp. ANT_WB101]|uniref:D-erythronate dehydrogenase n=1 Tax=Pusillimonas sp. ANT_WB101 TaxID=2597356 RepID=UPI0011EBF709|nr:D-erythronate dehydrogenase [Pusillimonas sp. ANT_WB101]KAA0910520.1 SDR family oxidoreductase [Pusillimonas sp. ANT_WB101]